MKDMLKISIACLFTLMLISCGGGGSSTPPPPPPPPPGLTVSPSSATVALGASQQFSATSSTTGMAVTASWSVNNVQGGNSTLGTIDGTGKYTAPASLPSPNTLTVTASASGASGNATLTVAFPIDNRAAQTVPVKMGTSGGDATDFVDSGGTRTCCSGTLGALVTRGGATFILSNNHVLAKSDAPGTTGDNTQQPGLVDNRCDVASAPPATLVGNLTEAAPLKPSPCSPSPCTGPAPSNVDAAIAAINVVNVDGSGAILDLGVAGSSSIAAARPSSTVAIPAVGQSVAKSGRSTGLTCSAIGSVTTDVKVQYNATCGGSTAFTSTFTNQLIINGGSFSSSGDSGALVVTSDKAQPVGLLFAGDNTSTTANPIQDVLAAFAGGGATTIVGGPDHAVSCQPTAAPSLASGTPAPSSANLSAQEMERATTAKDKVANRLLENRAISEVTVGASVDNPQEAALVITVDEATIVPAVIEGVRTRVMYAYSPAPRARVDATNGATLLKRATAQRLMQQSAIQGVGIGISDDNPAEPAMVIYVVSGVARAAIPAMIDGLRTKIIEGDRFRAFGWGKETKPSACSPKQSPPKNSTPLPH
jgi:hypothetical protein